VTNRRKGPPAREVIRSHATSTRVSIKSPLRDGPALDPLEAGVVIGVRSAGAIIGPGVGRTEVTRTIRRATGFGRWIFCKYCYQKVRPAIGSLNQVVCFRCGSGLTPDFFTMRGLKEWWTERIGKGRTRVLASISIRDHGSDEAKRILFGMDLDNRLSRVD
jgi:hypothetical protein